MEKKIKSFKDLAAIIGDDLTLFYIATGIEGDIDLLWDNISSGSDKRGDTSPLCVKMRKMGLTEDKDFDTDHMMMEFTIIQAWWESVFGPFEYEAKGDAWLVNQDIAYTPEEVDAWVKEVLINEKYLSLDINLW